MSDETPVESEAPSEEAVVTKPRGSVSASFRWLVGGVCVAALVQLAAPYFDYQNANILSSVAVVTTGLWFTFVLHRRFAAEGMNWAIPATLLAAVIIFATWFEFVGFSGEMRPQFRSRFRSTASQPQSAPGVPVASPEVEPNVGEAKPTPYAQFLGPDRNGVIPRREFIVPGAAEDVEVLWDIGVGEGWSSFAVSQGRAITTEQRDNEEWLTCYRLGDGQLLWANQHAGRHEHLMGGVGPRSTPTIEGSNVYATSATGFLWCVDWEGTTIWEQNLLALAGWSQSEFEQAAPWGYSISPLIVDGLCVVALGGPVGGERSASLIALDAATGEEQWRAGDDQLSYASPVVMTLAGTRQIVSVNEKTVTGHAIADGQVLWSFDWPGSTNTGANCASAVPVGSDQVLVGKGYGGGSALVRITKDTDQWRVEDVWQSSRLLQTKFNHTCVSGNVGFGIGNGALQAVDLNDPPSRVWQQPRRQRSGQGQVLLVEDTLVLQDEGGDVVFVDVTGDSYSERLRLPALTAKTWNIPSVAGRHVIVRNSEQAICFRLPPRDE